MIDSHIKVVNFSINDKFVVESLKQNLKSECQKNKKYEKECLLIKWNNCLANKKDKKGIFLF